MNAIVGLGNPILTDDAVGLAVARAVYEEIVRCHGEDQRFAELIEAAVGGFDLIERLVGYEKAVVIDAIQTAGGRAGDYYLIDLESASLAKPPAIRHRMGLLEGLDLARKLAMDIPKTLHIYAVEAADVLTFSSQMTEQVQAAVPRVARAILAEEFGIQPLHN
ncbi:MAG: hydrogenase maturation protease [Candidatus Sumerlaeota bacterium]|nr:hydrogenase maturation protease [Candidatus Sumerlaeota bacterium]